MLKDFSKVTRKYFIAIKEAMFEDMRVNKKLKPI